MIEFNLSPSAINCYNDSQLNFYYTYIKKAPPDTKPYTCYGSGGTVVHTILENYAVDKNYKILNNFDALWKKYHLDADVGLNGKPLNKSQYMKAVLNGKKFLDSKYLKCNPEETIVFPAVDNEKFKINYKGIVDLPCYDKDGNFLIIDWKTSSSISEDDDNFKLQATHYCWSFWKKYNKLPKKFIFEYVKINKSVEYIFDEIDMIRHEEYLNILLKEIMDKGDDITKYEVGDYHTPFCVHKQKIGKVECERQVVNDKNVKKLKFMLRIKNGKIYILNKLSDLLLRMLKKQFRYEVKDAYYVRQNSNWDGIVRLFNEKYQSVGIGFLNRLLNILEKYCNHKNMKFEYEIIEDDNPEIKLDDFKEKLINITLRKEQEEAVNVALKNKACRLKLPTGVGKTILAAEFIRQHKLKTLFIVDRIDLLTQTKDEFENVLGMNVGSIGGGVDKKDWITVATYQSLSKKPDNFFREYQCVIVDECQTAAAKSIIKILKKCTITHHRVGLSATPKHSDDDMLIESQLGRIEYNLATTIAQEKGYLVNAGIKFYHVPLASNEYDWRSDYDFNIVNNNIRNEMIINYATEKAETGETSLILTKSVKHGRMLKERVNNSYHICGKVNKNIRKELWDGLREKNIKVIIATLSIASKGLNIKSLNNIINASGNGNSKDSIQVLGRVLRLFNSKDKGVYIDYFDKGKYSKVWSRVRYEGLKKEGHDIKIVNHEK